MSKRAREGDAAPAGKAKRAKETPQAPGIGLAWGQNSLGQVGIGLDKDERKKPALIALPEGTSVKCCISGGLHTVVVTTDGKVLTFGCNDEFALGRTAVADEGEGWDKDEVEARPGQAEGLDGLKIVAASAGDSHTFVLTDDGAVYGCGCFRDPSGALGFSDVSLLAKQFTQLYPPDAEGSYPPAKQLVSGTDHVAILCEAEDGTTKVFTYGSADQGQLGRCGPNKCARDHNYRGKDGKAMPEGFEASLEKRRTTVACIQTLLRFHEVPNGPWKSRKLVSIFAGGWSTGVVDEKGEVYAWGLNNYGQIGIKPSKKNSTVEFAPKKCVFLKGCAIQKIAAGQHHSVCLSTGGEVYTIGRGDTGQLGVVESDGSVTNESSTLKKLDLKDVVDVATGSSCSYAIDKAGKAYSWGFGENLQLGGDDESDRPTPMLLSSKQVDNRIVTQIDAGGQHACGVAHDKQ